MYSPLQVLKISCTLACMILSFSGTSNGASTSSDVEAASNPGNSAPLVPQVGYLEERSDDKIGGNAAVPTGNTGILVPVVSVVNPEDSSPKAVNPLVALLPTPPEIKQSTDAETLPVVATLPIVPLYDQPESAPKQEIQRSLRDASTRRATISASHDGDSSETMDVAEDIVFRPLFRIRQNTARNSPYSADNLRRNNAFRRYNVNGYYRVPYNNQPRYKSYNSAGYDNDS